jgi:ribonuclease D
MKLPTMIETGDMLLSLIDQIEVHGIVAVDTEFVWERTYFPRVGIIQIGLSKKSNYIIDALAIRDLSPLGRILADNAIVKILHDAQQDLTILRRVTGVSPRNIFDTRLAAGFAGLDSTISLRSLLQELFGIEIEKSETRTDWLRRPLSEKQIAYAINDVRYLPAAREALLSGIGCVQLKWLQEELKTYNRPDLYEEKVPDAQYLRITRTNRLGSRELAILRELAAWREMEAVRKDIPRAWVIPDKTLLAIAKGKPEESSALEHAEGVSSKILNRNGQAILKAVAKGIAVDPKDCPPPAAGITGKRGVNAKVDSILANLKRKSMEWGIDPGLVTSRSQLKTILNGDRDPLPHGHPLSQGWRKELLDDECGFESC